MDLLTPHHPPSALTRIQKLFSLSHREPDQTKVRETLQLKERWEALTSYSRHQGAVQIFLCDPFSHWEQLAFVNTPNLPTMEANSSVTSVLANARYGGVSIPPQVDQIVDAVASSGPWTLAFTILAVLVAYDQSEMLLTCASTARRVQQSALTITFYSHVHREEGLYRRSCDEAPLHGPLPAVSQPQV